MSFNAVSTEVFSNILLFIILVEELTTTPLWWHHQVVVIPDVITYNDAAMLYITSGSRTSRYFVLGPWSTINLKNVKVTS